jgi:hypothetical protein
VYDYLRRKTGLGPSASASPVVNESSAASPRIGPQVYNTVRNSVVNAGNPEGEFGNIGDPDIQRKLLEKAKGFYSDAGNARSAAAGRWRTQILQGGKDAYNKFYEGRPRGIAMPITPLSEEEQAAMAEQGARVREETMRTIRSGFSEPLRKAKRGAAGAVRSVKENVPSYPSGLGYGYPSPEDLRRR